MLRMFLRHLLMNVWSLCGCWSWSLSTFLSHRVGLTSRWCWKCRSCCGVRGLLISRLVSRCWRRIWLCWFGTWYLRLSPPIFAHEAAHLNKLVNFLDVLLV
jgi:hypothetical protein